MLKIKNGSIGSIFTCLMFAGGLLLGTHAVAGSGAPGGQPVTGVMLLAQAGGSCASKCEVAKKSCMAQYTVTNSHGVRMVTPDGAKRCWAAFHQCKSYCK